MTHFSSTRHMTKIVVLASVLGAVACSPDRLVRSDPPSDILMPSGVTSADAAMALYNGAASMFAVALGGGSSYGGTSFVRTTGLLTDELAQTFGNSATSTDLRNSSSLYPSQDNSENSELYTFLQTARVNAFQARQALRQYGDSATDRALIGRAYAFEAYTIVMLAEYFCDGIPLSETPLDGETVLSPGMSTDALLAHAVVLFDSAIAFSADSVNVVNMAKVGKGRALLDQGEFAAAATAVADVPVTFAYQVHFRSQAYVLTSTRAFYVWNFVTYPYSQGTIPYAVIDHEGGAGLRWSTDPRVPLANQDGNNYPAKYGSGDAPIRLADGIEAQLIRAEADLQGGGSAWLGLLNDLRANCTSASGCAPVPGITGGTVQLPPLPDSGSAVGRIREVMAERAYWMYITGHRQGDLRRLLRPPYNDPPYSFTQSAVYPSGAYGNPNYTGPTALYGSDVVARPAMAEQKYNVKYDGCFDLNP